MPRIGLFFLLGFLIQFAGSSLAQTALDPRHIDALTIGPPIDIGSTWLAHQGDDPSYADPRLDDSQWIVVLSSRKITTYFPGVDELWYRTHVQVAPGSRNLGIRLRYFNGSYQVFANGRQISAPGSFPPGGTMYQQSFDGVVSIPDALIGDGHLTIAIRARVGNFVKAEGEGGLFESQFFLGPAQQLSDGFRLILLQEFGSNFLTVELDLLLLVSALGLAFTMRSDREYLAVVIFIAASLLRDCWPVSKHLLGFQGIAAWGLGALLGAVIAVAEIEFCRVVLRFRRSRAVVAYEWFYFAMSVLNWLLLMKRFASSTNLYYASSELMSVPLHFGLPLLALWTWRRRRNPDALLLLVPLLVTAFYDVAAFLPYVRHLLAHTDSWYSLYLSPIPFFNIGWSELDHFVFLLTLPGFLIIRALRIARSRAALAAEVKAAQTIQQLLLARASQPTPGFVVDSVYLPASEVGGDFFLVSPAPDGSVIALVGDVSGKGLLAAMRVSMILGVLQRESSRVPATILGNLNRALLTQGEMGFTTACCVRLHRDGEFTVANAGQIPPYVDGEEIETNAGLPLGLASDQEYPEITGRLSDAQTMVLTSDGVVEARNAKGELYGFERLGPLTRRAAIEIASAAQAFGQDDDITVLTLACAT